MTRTIEKQILVAGIGNMWLGDDGFAGEVVKRLEQRQLPPGVTVLDFGTGGLDLAYEVMRGYDALVLIDAGRRGGEPGTLYVMEAEEAHIAAGIEDGELLDPHSMDPATMLRFVRAVGGWPGRVLVIACEPGAVDEIGPGLTSEVAAALDDAVELVVSTVDELCSQPVEAG
jgi:hydrogenase maturation protease